MSYKKENEVAGYYVIMGIADMVMHVALKIN